jgi:hypothetical protein
MTDRPCLAPVGTPAEFWGFYSGPTAVNGHTPFSRDWHESEAEQLRCRLFLKQEGHYGGATETEEKRLAWHLWSIARTPKQEN